MTDANRELSLQSCRDFLKYREDDDIVIQLKAALVLLAEARELLLELDSPTIGRTIRRDSLLASIPEWISQCVQ